MVILLDHGGCPPKGGWQYLLNFLATGFSWVAVDVLLRELVDLSCRVQKRGKVVVDHLPCCPKERHPREIEYLGFVLGCTFYHLAHSVFDTLSPLPWQPPE